MSIAHVEFRAMGSACRIVVDGGPEGLADSARLMVGRLEAQWTRFDTNSDVSNLNEYAGSVVLVSDETYLLVEHAVVAQRSTTGRFNPLMLDQLVSLGYATDWAAGTLAPRVDEVRPGSHQQIELFPEVNGVCLPSGTRFDPGGIGKGLAADLVTRHLVAQGATTTSVELGGDLRVHGTPWYGPQWRVGVVHPFDPDAEVVSFIPVSGAVATSSRLRKQWVAEGRSYHHVLDPRTGMSAMTDVVTASCCAATAWWAEVAAKVALIAGSDDAIDVLDQLGVTGVVITENGQVYKTEGELPTGTTGECEGVAV